MIKIIGITIDDDDDYFLSETQLNGMKWTRVPNEESFLFISLVCLAIARWMYMYFLYIFCQKYSSMSPWNLWAHLRQKDRDEINEDAVYNNNDDIEYCYIIEREIEWGRGKRASRQMIIVGGRPLAEIIRYFTQRSIQVDRHAWMRNNETSTLIISSENKMAIYTRIYEAKSLIGSTQNLL